MQIGKQVVKNVIKGVYRTLEEAILYAQGFADAFDMEGCVRITHAPEGGFELFGTGKLVKLI